ncbi:hypothetical protein T265_13187, partial [Opisthorchis viverrini]
WSLKLNQFGYNIEIGMTDYARVQTMRKYVGVHSVATGVGYAISHKSLVTLFVCQLLCPLLDSPLVCFIVDGSVSTGQYAETSVKTFGVPHATYAGFNAT